MNRDQVKLFLETRWLEFTPTDQQANQYIWEHHAPYSLWHLCRRGLFSNWVIPNRGRLAADHLAAAHEAARRFFAGRAPGWSWEVFEDDADWVIPRLEEFGYRWAETVECMAARLPLYGADPDQGSVAEARVCRVRTEPEVRLALEMDDSYDEHTKEQLEAAIRRTTARLDHPDHTLYLAYWMEEPAAMSGMDFYPEEHLAYLNGATTKPGFRGRGLYSRILGARVRDAWRCGLEWACTHADTETSAPILKKHGFETLSKIHVYQTRSGD